jgi:hypothetical protein
LFVKASRHDLLTNKICGAFELPSLKNTQKKRDKTIETEGKMTWKFSQKHMPAVFELPSPTSEQRPKRT